MNAQDDMQLYFRPHESHRIAQRYGARSSRTLERNGLKGERTPLAARVVALAEVLFNPRYYKTE